MVHTSTRVELSQLETWAARQSRPEDTLVLEASGNAFAVAGRLRALGRKVHILESHRAGQVAKSYCANDRIDAVKLARIYLSGLSPVVWQPDPLTLDAHDTQTPPRSCRERCTAGSPAGWRAEAARSE